MNSSENTIYFCFSGSVLNFTTNRPTNSNCALPYLVSYSPGIPQFYCKQFFTSSKPTKRVCGLQNYPQVSSTLGVCKTGIKSWNLFN